MALPRRGTDATLVDVIITFTANPSLDRTAALVDALAVGQVNRLGPVTTRAAGKGVNVSAAVHAAGVPTVAVLPVDPHDPLNEALRASGIPTRAVPTGRWARTNLSIAHPDGTVTRFNEPGERMSHENVTALVSTLMSVLPGSTWLALCGSLPPGAPADWYCRLQLTARQVGVKVAIDASGVALDATLAGLPGCAPDLLAPNARELGIATGTSLRESLDAGDLAPTVAAAESLVARGVTRVLTTLADSGALLTTASGTWHARPEPVEVVSPVSAGDSTLAGYLMADVTGADEDYALARAVAYGTACVLLPGSEVPCPDQADDITVEVQRLV